MPKHYQVNTGVPIPAAQRGAPIKLPYKSLAIGESFSSPSYIDVRRFNAPGKAFLCRVVEEDGQRHWRVWRTE